MIILLLVGLAGLFVLRQTGLGAASAAVNNSPLPDSPAPRPLSTVRSPVVNNSTGSSLSQALGNANRSPRYYASGNPGTTGITLPSSSSIAFMRPKWTPAPITRTVSNPIAGNVTQHNPPRPVKTTEQTAVGVKRVNSALVNPAQNRRPVTKPEWPGAFWTKRVQ